VHSKSNGTCAESIIDRAIIEVPLRITRSWMKIPAIDDDIADWRVDGRWTAFTSSIFLSPISPACCSAVCLGVYARVKVIFRKYVSKILHCTNNERLFHRFCSTNKFCALKMSQTGIYKTSSWTKNKHLYFTLYYLSTLMYHEIIIKPFTFLIIQYHFT